MKVDKASISDRLAWFDERRQMPECVDITRQYRQLAEHLVDESDSVGPELLRALDNLLASLDDALRVVTLATQRANRRQVASILVEKKDAHPPLTAHNASDGRKS